MKNMIKNSIRASVLMMAAALTFASCSDWTETESIDINTPSLEEQNPELYAAYLKSLNEYKAGPHKVLFVTFDNRPTAPSKQAERLTALPDSIDFVILDNPEAFYTGTTKEMVEVRKKGTRVVYNVDYPKIDAEWEKLLKADKAGVLTEEDALAHITKRVDEMLAFYGKDGYDGIVATYPGRSLVSLPEAALAVYAARQTAFVGAIAAWRAKNPNAACSLITNPQYLTEENSAILAQLDYIIVITDRASNESELTRRMLMAQGGFNVPTDRFVVTTETTRPGDADREFGYFSTIDADGQPMRAIKGCALWAVAASANGTRAGLLIRNGQLDYFDPLCVYRYTRQAIGIMNPSPKN